MILPKFASWMLCPVHHTPYERCFIDSKEVSFFYGPDKLVKIPITQNNHYAAIACCACDLYDIYGSGSLENAGLRLGTRIQRQALRATSTSLAAILEKTYTTSFVAPEIPTKPHLAIFDSDTAIFYITRVGRTLLCRKNSDRGIWIFDHTIYTTTSTTREEQIAELMLVLPLEHFIRTDTGWLPSQFLIPEDLRPYRLSCLQDAKEKSPLVSLDPHTA